MEEIKSIRSKLEGARRDLLELSTRSRLLSVPRSSKSSRILQIVDEKSEEVFRILARDCKMMTFLSNRKRPGNHAADDDPEDVAEAELDMDQPEEDDLDENGVPKRHTDNKLQTNLTSEALQKSLLNIYYDARSAREEQGVNILYLSLGLLKWIDGATKKEYYAPLLLLPVSLERASARTRFRLEFNSGEELSTNLSLQAKLAGEFGIVLPELPEIDDLSPSDYFARVKEAIADQPGWEVLEDDIVLSLYSFSKFLMYRDLDPENWPEKEGRSIDKNPLLGRLLSAEGFAHEAPLCGDDDHIDTIVQPEEAVHIVDADSSQAIAIEEVKRGRNLVIQGPPGTGKSQTIANLIGAAVQSGKKVLFVAEKMAALEVVKSRLDRTGLGELCLEVHSHKANKRVVLEELGKTLGLGKPKDQNLSHVINGLRSSRDELNRHVEYMHTPMQPSGLTPYRVIGEMVRLQRLGVAPADYTLPKALSWTVADQRRKATNLKDLCVHLETIGVPAEYFWRGVGLESILPTDIQRFSGQIPPVVTAVESLRDAAKIVADSLGVPAPELVDEVQHLSLKARRLGVAPVMDRQAMANEVWERQHTAIEDLVQQGNELVACQAKLKGVLAEAAWSANVAETRRDLAAYGGSFFSFLNGKFRRAKAEFKGLLAGAGPKKHEEQLEVLDTLIKAKKHIEEIRATDTLGANAFGSYWRGERTEWPVVSKILEWDNENRRLSDATLLRRRIGEVQDLEKLERTANQLDDQIKGCLRQVEEVFLALKLDLKVAFGVEEARRVAISVLVARMQQWRDDTEAMTKWIAYRTRSDTLRSEGLGELADRLFDGRIKVVDAENHFHMVFYETLIREMARVSPDFAGFDGRSHEQVLDRFRRFDRTRIDLARVEVALKHHEGLPLTSGALGEVGLIRRELQKKRRHMPLRQLMKQAGNAIQAIKPVFMMSPMSIAQYLEPGTLEFDLLLIDEASQIRPVDALGAIARAKQIVVVGDDKQLPPTQFFNKLMADESVDDEDPASFQAGDLESILGLCSAQNMNSRMLRWHYRSRHHSLIAVSNQEFYDNRLYVIPSVTGPNRSVGLRLHYLEDAVFDRGKTATNKVEAQTIARAVMDHARDTPELSLGVGTFSMSQKEAVLNEIEHLRRKEKDYPEFFSVARAEPFFVKNLETIQGDERDVIMISIGYGRDAKGNLTMNFGPLSAEGGERRLNVLITRARLRCEVFSSIKAGDIDTERASGRGAQALRSFLTYAENGLLNTSFDSNKEYGAVFEEEVGKAIEAHGYKVVPRLGIAGVFIDLAVEDPEHAGRYLLGIECDGIGYHEARSARDRDRVRQAVLEDHGWMIHRVWCADWFNRPQEELRKVLDALEEAKKRKPSKEIVEAAASSNEAVEEADSIERARASRKAPKPAFTAAKYKEASFRVSTKTPPYDLPVEKLAEVVVKVIDIEGPVHKDELPRRVASLHKMDRTTSKVSEAVDLALAEAVRSRQVVVEGDFLDLAAEREVRVRDRSDVESSNLRKIEMIAPKELRRALLGVIEIHLGIEQGDAIREVAKMFGYKSTSPQTSAAISQELTALLSNEVRVEGGRLYLREQ